MSATSACPRSAPTTIRRAHAVHPIVDLQIEYSLISRGIENDILPTCRELGIGITAYGVLSRGLISGHWSKDRPARGDFRAHEPALPGREPRRQSGARRALRARSPSELGATPRAGRDRLGGGAGQDIVPLVGARRRDRLTEALGALDVKLTRGASRRRSQKRCRPEQRPATRYPDGAARAHGQREESLMIAH